MTSTRIRVGLGAVASLLALAVALPAAAQSVNFFNGGTVIGIGGADDAVCLNGANGNLENDTDGLCQVGGGTDTGVTAIVATNAAGTETAAFGDLAAIGSATIGFAARTTAGDFTGFNALNFVTFDAAGNTTRIQPESTTITDFVGNQNVSTATDNSLSDTLGNSNRSTALGNVLLDTLGNTNVATAASSTLTDAAGNTNTSEANNITLINVGGGGATQVAADGIRSIDGAGLSTFVGVAPGVDAGFFAIDTTTGNGVLVSANRGINVSNNFTVDPAGNTFVGGNFAIDNGSTVNMGNNVVSGVADPILGTDAVNLRTLNAAINDLDDELSAGIAIATALENPDLTGNERFGVMVNYGNYEGSGAVGISAVGVLGNNVFDDGDRVAIAGAVGFSTQESQVAGRVGIQWTR